jgi:integrase
MSALYNHAIRWQFTDKNPITGPVKGAGVRVSAKRMSIPDILTVDEMQTMLSAVLLRERVLIFLDMVTGLRRGELAGLKWADIDFLNLQIDVSRSVDQYVGRCKTEISQKPVPIDEYIAADLPEWYRQTPYPAPTDLKANGEDVKVVQELLRHASTKVTLDVYAQALTPARRAAQRKVVLMIRENLSVPRVYREDKALGRHLTEMEKDFEQALQAQERPR